MYSFKQRERGSFLNTKQNDCSFISLPGKRLSLLSVTFPFVCCSFFTTNLCGCFEKLVIYFFILNRRANINQYSPKDATYFSLVLNKCIAGAPSFAEDMFSECVLLCLSLSLIVKSTLTVPSLQKRSSRLRCTCKCLSQLQCGYIPRS